MHRQRGRQPENRLPAPFYESLFYRRPLSAVSSRAAAPALPVCSVILRFSADLPVLDRHRRSFDPGDPGNRSVSIPGDPDALRLD